MAENKNKKVEYCASTFIIDYEEQRICLIYHKKFQNWIQPGGHLKEGETPEEGAIRKAKEETGLDVKLVTGKPFIVEEYKNFVGDLLDYQYLAVPKDPGQPLVNSDESYEIDWFSLQELNNIPVFPDVKSKAKMFLKVSLETE